MRNMSFMLTTEQIKNKTKTVTRRLGWSFLKPGDLVQAVEKCQGLKKGEKIKKLCVIRIKSIRKEALDSITCADVIKEGFDYMTRDDFITMFCAHNKCYPYNSVNRIEFEYME